MPPNRAAFFFFLSWGPISDGARQVARTRGRGPPWRRWNSLPPSRSNPHRGPQRASPLGGERSTASRLPAALPSSPSAEIYCCVSKMPPNRAAFFVLFQGPHLGWGAPGGACKGRSPLGAGGIHFRRAGPIPTGDPKGPALWGEKEVRPESRSPRSPVLQALRFIAALQKCRPTGRHFLFSSRGPLPARAKGDILIPYHTKEGK